ncbi:hypothetical protein COEREDRAFT_92961 [Coemansia reversa NRRL 1564]|uniref:Uncharacterized protein n=1 Tax=Coemansia reversa (strain ATCC 12441 / NRRL 1564) TaxID=763665 RepID=A0A2G5BAE9_COERN|nr:hypothetical protein COEREDRAFT_92961 [Coemansia reversa NRRL 1564]|eukprot:PIA15984.1 hypothetical protein COEREDRAFT_92961 [Coemansia reversa NRRL 1564]
MQVADQQKFKYFQVHNHLSGGVLHQIRYHGSDYKEKKGQVPKKTTTAQSAYKTSLH